jgi:chromosome segregation ATPase
MGMAKATLDSLHQKLSELNDKYNQLYASYQLQQESLNKVDQKKQDLQHALDEAQTAKSELTKRMEKLSKDKDARGKRIHEESTERHRITTKLYRDISSDTNSNRRTRQMLVMRLAYLKEKWAPVEQDFMRQISAYDQQLLMINAKKAEVAQRLKALRDRRKRTGFLTVNPEFFEMLGGSLDTARSILPAPTPYQMLFNEDSDDLQRIVEGKRRELNELVEECRALQELRNRLLANKREAPKDAGEAAPQPAAPS